MQVKAGKPPTYRRNNDCSFQRIRFKSRLPGETTIALFNVAGSNPDFPVHVSFPIVSTNVRTAEQFPLEFANNPQGAYFFPSIWLNLKRLCVHNLRLTCRPTRGGRCADLGPRAAGRLGAWNRRTQRGTGSALSRPCRPCSTRAHRAQRAPSPGAGPGDPC